MDRNKRTARTLTAALCLALLAGCGAETAGESLDADEMHPGWSTVTTDPSAYGITYQELEDLSGMPLDQLTAYCLGADGVYGENGFDQLYHRFLEAPDTVLSYLALIDSREERDGFLPEFRKLCEEYGVKLYCEDEGFLTDLFPAALNKDRFNVIFYQEDAVLQEYLALKEEKRKARETGAYTPEKRREIAWRYGKLLSYTDEGIERLLAANRDRED